MEIMTGALGTLLPKLAKLLTDRYKLQRCLRGEIMFLKAELESMQAALEKVSDAPVTDNQVRIWARDVRELSYDIEDSIDRFMVCVDTDPSAPAELHGFRGFIQRSLKLLTTANTRHRIAKDIRGIKVLVREVASRRDRYSTDSSVSSIRSAATATVVDPRLIGLYEEARKLVGISGPQEELKMLMEPEATSLEDGLKVISIVGVGGLGKTTLANAVYQQLRGQFDCHAFVSVSLRPDLNRILSSILRQVSEQHYCSTETWPVEEIIDKIRLFLDDKRYIIILDDIWDISAWKHIKCALVHNCGSRIITTSRVLEVATSCCSEIDGTIYKLKPLSDDDSKKLFFKRIFGSENGCHSELKETSEKILKKCGGVPLAINTVASLLASKPRNINQWYNVHNSIGTGLDKSPSVENMRKVLSISYYGLPVHLKPCLLYLSIFPDDYNISKDQLIRRWISEGFIPGEDVVTLYELGGTYFNELINRSMIEPEYIDTHGSILTCRVHDMVLDLIASLSYEENFSTTIPSKQSTYFHKKMHRLSFQSNAEGQAIPKAIKLSHLRSLIVFPGSANLLPPLSSFHLLRVLDFEGCHDLESYQIDGLGNLFHLRSLVLKDTNIAKLPKEIGKLRCLQTLDLRKTSIGELPSTVVQLRQLVRLHVDKSVMLPSGFGAMKSLQVLSYIGVCKTPNLITELGNLNELRILHISLSGTRHMNCEKHLTDSLSNLEKLHELCILGGFLSKLSMWINSSLLCLNTLDMKLKTLTQEDFENLGSLWCLLDVRLMVLKIEPEKLVIGIDHEEFQSLVKFSFVSNAMRLLFAQKAMPRLENLELGFRVQETKDFDLGLENLSSLRYAMIRIDCGTSNACEVERADATIRKAAFVNPNHPRLDIFRHFEAVLIRDDRKLQVPDETRKTEEEAMVSKMGPWGGNGGDTCDIKVIPHHLESVIICSGTIIDALAFSYWDRNGHRHTTQFWGGILGNVQTIVLGTSEYLMEVSGTTGPFSDVSEVITSLKLVSNVRCYGPFGEPRGTRFCSRAKKNSSIVGFFGRSGNHLDAIGVYFHPI
ncbi:disease resistance protein RGA5-like [Miscanthus floridulus]|uniref:disease resistance protein RGA5-like n=1 Tax=Miscanthus floridulus TaxID=154761 RepID=UPI0034582B64